MVEGVYDKGTLFVAPGGGGALTPLAPGLDGYVLIRDDEEDLGVGWAAAVPGDGDVVGPASSTDNALARYDSTTGKLLQNSPVTCADTTGTMTWPAGGGPVLTAGGTGSERKGTITLSSGTHAKVLTTAAVTGCVIVYTTVTLGTVTVASSFLTTIDTGVGFTPVASQNTDASVVNWAIVA